VVPAILVGGPAGVALRDGRLADVAPTLLELMQLPVPPEMNGQSLIMHEPQAAEREPAFAK
jgi:2,3-bisphosphoglycerate-independent phosphoglycerate mutase